MCFLGFGLILGGVCGLILCFYAQNNFTIFLFVSLSLLILSGGVFLLYTSFKDIRSSNILTKNTEFQNHYLCQEIHPSIIEKDVGSFNSEDQLKTYIETENITCRADEKPISNEETPYLIQVGYEKAISTEQNNSNPKFHRTEREENLSFNFMMKYGSHVDTLTEKFETAYRNAYKTNDLDEKISLLSESIKAFEKAKKFCYSKGKGGTVYFQDMWEHLHNSQNKCFSYLDNIEASLAECMFQRDVVIPKIIDITTHTPGILQKNIYKLLPDMDKSTIQHTIKYLESKDKISRIKKGNSYELHINE